ncbi:MAG: PKD domain-containing protein [Saprospiraceae bacterium]
MKKSLFTVVLITLLASANVALAQIQMTFSIAHPSCHGYTNGSVTVFAIGGTSPYSYNWNNGQTTQTCTGIGAGQYTVTVTDATSSTASGSIAVSEPSAVTVAITSNNVGCDGASGTLTATGYGGTAPYSYAWDGPNSSSTATVAVTAPGNYFVTVTDANGCAGVGNYTVASPITVEVIATDIPCSIYPNGGALNAVVTGGVTPYTFSWSNGAISQLVTGVGAGTYFCTVTSANGCTAIDSDQVDIPTPLEATIVWLTPACGGNNNGAATVQASGGTPPYTYTWTPGPLSGPSQTGLAPGQYYVCVFDANLCQKDIWVNIPATTGLDVQMVVTSATCPGIDNATATAVVSPPGSGYVYEWTKVTPDSVVTHITGVIQLTGLAVGTIVSVTVTDPVSGCSGTASGVVGAHNIIEIAVTDVDILCEGGFGSATAVASNGTPPYTYTWYHNNLLFGDSSSIFGLNPGAYQVIVEDSLGCEATSVADIGILSAPNAAIVGGNVLICGDSLSTVQFLNASTDQYNTITSLVWVVNGPNINTTILQQNQITFQLPVDDTITVTLIATSGLGCSDTATLVYNVPGYPDFSLVIDSTTLNCAGDSVRILVIGGDTTHTYVWTPGVTFAPDPLNVLVNPVVTTTYVLTATDGNVCTATDSITISPYGLFELYVSETLIRTCADSVTITATTNIPSTIIWVLEGDIAFSGNTITVPATAITSIYTVTAVSGDSCVLKEEVSVTGFGIDISLDSNAVLTICEGGSLPLSVISTPMSDSLTYVWTVEAPAVLSSSTAANPILTGPPGIYTVTVIVTNVICSDTLSFEVEILPGTDLSGQFLADLCDGLHAQFFNNSGIDGTWNFGDGSPLSSETNPVHIYDSAGVYHVVFTPAVSLQCLITWDSVITIFADTLIAGIAHNYVDCINQAEIQFLGSANRPDSLIVSWAWTFTNGTPTTSTLQNPIVTLAQEDTITATLITKDINNCLDTTSVQLTATIVHDTIPNAAQICPGDSVQLNPGGFDLGASYFWTSVPFDSTLIPNIPNPTVYPLVATTYTVQIIKGLCTVDYIVQVNLKPGAEVTLPDDMVACSPDSLSITAQSNGATGYEWSIFPDFSVIFGNTQTVLVLPPGTFYVRTTGADCFGVDSVHIDIGSLDVQIVSVNDIICPGDFGSASALGSIGTPPYTYAWYNSDNVLIGNDQNIMGLDTGAYTVIVTDSVGCTAEATINIDLLSAPNAIIDGGHVLVCGDSISSVQFINQSNDLYDVISSFAWILTGPTVSYVISNQDTITLPLPVDETITVQLIVTSSLNCKDTTTIEYNVPGYPDLTLHLDSTTINCSGDSVSIQVFGGGDPTHTYIWSPAVTLNPDSLNVLVHPSVTTTYVLTATDGNVCTATDSITVAPTVVLELFLSETEIRTCSDSVTITASTNIPATIIWILEGDIAFDGNTITVLVTDTTQIYIVKAISGDSCIVEEEVSVTGFDIEINIDPTAVLSICEGNSLPLSVISTPLSASLTYLWTVEAPAVLSDSTAANPILTGPAGTYTVTVIVTNVICSDTLSFQVEILPGFNLEGLISADLCNGLEVSFFSDSLISGVWNFGDGTTSNDPNPVHTYNPAGQYYVVFTSNLQCTPAWDSTIHVNAAPIEASLTAISIKCVDQAEIQFSGFTNLLQSDSVVWAWTFANGIPASSSQQNPIVTYSEEDTVTATLIVQDINMCRDTFSMQLVIHIIQDTIPNALEICPGDSIQLNPGGYDLGASYQWTSVPFDSTLNVLDPTPVVSPSVPTSYSVEIKEGLFCSTLNTVDLSFKPGSDVSFVADTLIVCTGDTLSLTAQSNGATGFEWSSSPDFDPIFATTDTVRVLPNHTYYVRTTAECFDVDSIRIELEIPEIQIMPSDTNICLGEETTLILMNLNPDHILVNYDWEPDLPNMPNPIVSPSETTTYSVTVTNQFGCTASLVFPTIYVTTVSVDAEAAPDSLSFTNPITLLTATPGGNGNVISYSWWPVGVTNPNSPQMEASPKETTTYTVTVTTSDGCTAIDSVTVHFRESECVSPFVFVPNTFTPNNDEKNDRFIVRADGMTELRMIVWNRWGEIVYETDNPNDPGWDGTYKGKESTPDSFAWYVWLTCGNGDIFEGKGNVTLMK